MTFSSAASTWVPSREQTEAVDVENVTWCLIVGRETPPWSSVVPPKHRKEGGAESDSGLGIPSALSLPSDELEKWKELKLWGAR